MYEEFKRVDQERFKKIFKELISSVTYKKTSFEDRVEEKEDYYIVTEENRRGSHYVHLVPKVIYHKFRGFQIKSPNKEPPHSLLCGRKGQKEIKVACFGVDVKDVIEEYKT